MERSWHGDAADGAERCSRPATEVLQLSGARLEESVRARGPLDRQTEAYSRVLGTVVKLPPKPGSDLLNTINPFDPDVQDMRGLLAQPRRGSGERYAAARDGNGTRRRIERPVVYLDTAQGRWIADRRGSGSHETASLLPADAASVTERLVRWLDATA